MKVMTGNVIIDGRNIYDRQELEELGFVYSRIGEKWIKMQEMMLFV